MQDTLGKTDLIKKRGMLIIVALFTENYPSYSRRLIERGLEAATKKYWIKIIN